MNVLTKARLTGNLTLILGALIVCSAALVLGELNWNWIWLLGGLAVLTAVAQFIVSLIRPAAIRPAWDEQTVASHKGSYQFGYWMALVVFWVLFLLVHTEVISGTAALFLLAPVLIAAPAVWMAVATALGRAG